MFNLKEHNWATMRSLTREAMSDKVSPATVFQYGRFFNTEMRNKIILPNLFIYSNVLLEILQTMETHE